MRPRLGSSRGLVHLVADAIDGDDVLRVVEILFDLLSQIVDVAIERAFVDLADVVKTVEQPRARENFAGVLR